MRFIIVNGRNPRAEGECAFCRTGLAGTFTRDIETRIVYHNPYCLMEHIMVSTILIEGNSVQYVEIK